MIKEMTDREFEKKILELINNIKAETTIFLDDTAEKQRIRKEKAEKDIFYFAKTYFPHYIRADFGDPHKLMHQETEIQGQITAVAGFRGLGKTTFLGIVKPIWKALYELIYFNVKIAKNKELAKERTLAIRCEFLYNRRLIHDFGEQLSFTAGEEHDFVIKSGCRFLALGYKEGIRGKIHNSRRPDYIDIDDLEDHNSFNLKIAQDKLSFVTEEAYGAFEKGKGTLIWLGNRTHQKSALNQFYVKCQNEPNPTRKFLLIPADDGHFNPTWKENYTKDDLVKIYQAMGKFGYERHMRMNPIIEGIKFQEGWFRYYKELPEHFDKIVTYCDPSLGEKKTSDFKAIITLGMAKKKYYLLDCWIRKASIIEMIKKLYRLDEEFDTRIYMESVMWQKVLWDYIPQVAEIMGYLLPVSGIEERENKELRIERLEPLFEWGWILFPELVTEDIQTLIDQLLGFPAYPNDDGPDGLAGATKVLKVSSEPSEYKSAQKRTASELKSMH